MKKFTQIGLFCLVILALFIFNKIYFNKDIDKISQPIIEDEQTVQPSGSSIIKNLKYEVKLDKNNEYIITSDLSELINEKGIEIVKMKTVTAIIIDQNKIPLIIKSKYADYNNSNYNTQFRDNVSMEYMDHKIYSDKIDLSFENNIAKIFENVRYVGAYGTIKSDNIEVNLLTKKVDIFMNNENENVEVNKYRNVKR